MILHGQTVEHWRNGAVWVGTVVGDPNSSEGVLQRCTEGPLTVGLVLGLVTAVGDPKCSKGVLRPRLLKVVCSTSVSTGQAEALWPWESNKVESASSERDA